PGSVPACGDAGVVGPPVGQVGWRMATEAIKLITGTGEPLLGRLLFIDVLAATQREIPIAARARRSAPPPRPTPVGEEPPRTPLLSPADLSDRLGGADAPFVLDVREGHEVAEGGVPGAVHIPAARSEAHTSVLQ